MTKHMWVYSGLYSVPLIYTSIFRTITHSLDYCSFYIVSFKIKVCQFLIIFQNCFGLFFCFYCGYCSSLIWPCFPVCMPHVCLLRFRHLKKPIRLFGVSGDFPNLSWGCVFYGFVDIISQLERFAPASSQKPFYLLPLVPLCSTLVSLGQKQAVMPAISSQLPPWWHPEYTSISFPTALQVSQDRN